MVVDFVNVKCWLMLDSFQNFEVCVGFGILNQVFVYQYGFDFILCNCVQMEVMYWLLWIVGQVVDVVVEDMMCMGVEIGFDIMFENKDKLNQEFENFVVWDSLCDMIKWVWLYGGVLVVMMIDGQDVLKLLCFDMIDKGQFKGFCVFDCWFV